MDTALALRIKTDHGLAMSTNDALPMLAKSELVKRLTSDLDDTPLFYVWRIIALSEIPFAQHLDYTRKLIDKVLQSFSTPFGFSLSGKEKDFLPCYNAMLVAAMCRLGQAQAEPVVNGIEWINTHQPMERGSEVSLPAVTFDRYGGCFKNTPCYIGVAKSAFALFEYWTSTGATHVEPKLTQGIEYLLEHQLVKRKSEDAPITRHIMDISFPESYHLNIVELIKFAARANLLKDPRTQYAVSYLQQVKKANGWRMDFRYKANGYTTFDLGRNNGDWITHIISNALNGLAPVSDS